MKLIYYYVIKNRHQSKWAQKTPHKLMSGAGQLYLLFGVGEITKTLVHIFLDVISIFAGDFNITAKQ